MSASMCSKVVVVLGVMCSSSPLVWAQEDEPFEALDTIEEMPAYDDIPSIEDPDGSSENLSLVALTHVRSYALYGASLLAEDDGDLQDIGVAAGIARVRPTLRLNVGDVVAFDIAYDLIPLVGTRGGAGAFAVQNIGLSALRLVDLDPVLYTPDDAAWALQHNLDRLHVRLGRPGREVTVGRQAFGHGSARLFASTDLFAPFGPATIDTEFKRGVDALRATWALGELHEIEAWVIAHEPDIVSDEPDARLSLSEWMYLVRWRALFPDLFDLSIYAGSTYAQPTIGADVSTSIAGAAVYVEGVGRLGLDEEDETMVQATIGADYQWGSGISTIAEVYYSSLGDVAPFATALGEPSMARQVGELNYLGAWYAGVSASYAWELMQMGAGYIQNIQDGSLLLTWNGSRDIGEDASAGLGVILPLGKRPELTWNAEGTEAASVPRSEFGLFPLLVFTDVRVAF